MKKRGLSLVELILAMGILSIAIVLIVGLFLSLLRSSTKTADLTTGMFFGREKLREVIEHDQYWPVPADQATGLYTTDAATQTEFFSRVSSTPLSGSAPDYKGGYYISVDVWWWSAAPGQQRTGQGVLSTRVSQFYYPGVGVP